MEGETVNRSYGGEVKRNEVGESTRGKSKRVCASSFQRWNGEILYTMLNWRQGLGFQRCRHILMYVLIIEF